MSYQRNSKPGRFYVWMGADGLHIDAADTPHFIHGPAGRDNAKAVLRGLVDFLGGEGVEVRCKPGKPPEFIKKDTA